MQSYGYKINKTNEEIEFSSLVFEMPTLNLLAEIEFEKKLTLNTTTATLGSIRFYYLNDVMKAKGKYITQKYNALSISAVAYRFYDFIMTTICYSSMK